MNNFLIIIFAYYFEHIKYTNKNLKVNKKLNFFYIFINKIQNYLTL